MKSAMTDETFFFKGADVEVSNDDEGFRGAWYAATVVKPPSTSLSSSPSPNPTNFKEQSPKNPKVTIQYKTLMANEAGTKPLRETHDLVSIRPAPPREITRKFKFSEEVDAYHNDGWWEGIITGVLGDSKYAVFFRAAKEQINFHESDLRLHREWVHGKWVPPLENEKMVINKVSEKASKPVPKEKLSKGTKVEVSSDEEGFQGAWFAATVIKSTGKEKFLVEYQHLRNDDDTELMKEEIDALHIRPFPPEHIVVDRFNRFEEVDALYNDGWWVGIVVKVLSNARYVIYFRGTYEETEFDHSDLRLHQDWVDGRWVTPSKAMKL